MEKKVIYTYKSKHVQTRAPVEGAEKEFKSIQEYLDSLNKEKSE